MSHFGARFGLAALVLLSACEARTPQAFDQQMATFVGRPEADLVASLGLPMRTYDTDSHRLLQWDFLQPSSRPAIYPSIGFGFGSFGFGGVGFGVGTGVGMALGGAAAPQGCSVIFEIRGGLVQGFDRSGPGCVA